MTEQTVPAMLNSVLEPLASILVKLNRAALIANSTHLPPAAVATITATKHALDDAWESLQQVVVHLDPAIYKHEP